MKLITLYSNTYYKKLKPIDKKISQANILAYIFLGVE